MKQELRERGMVKWLVRGYRVLSGMGLATILLLLMAVLTWLATIEQVDHGLYATLERYFSWRSLVVFPVIEGRTIWLPLPTGYWVGVLLVINMTLGGVVHLRKGWRSVGNLVAHLGILMMLVAGGVAHHCAKHSRLIAAEGETVDYTQDLYEYTVEVAEMVDGKAKEIRVIGLEDLRELAGGEQRTFEFAGWPFQLVLTDYHENAAVVSATESAPEKGSPLIASSKASPGYWIYPLKEAIDAQANRPACYGKILHHSGQVEPLILAAASFYPYTFRVGERVFTVDMRKRVYPLPFRLRLDRFTMEMHPGTNKPKKYVSDVTKIGQGYESKSVIQMNEPLRHQGLTVYQASFDMAGGRKSSIFEVVSNPADKWPEYSLYVVSVGMIYTFVSAFIRFLKKTSKRRNHE